MTEFEKAQAIRNHMLSTAAQCWSYNWPADFQASELKDALAACMEKVGLIDISLFTAEQCKDLGFGLWSEESNLYLVPLWLFSLVEHGVILTSISGDKKVVSATSSNRESPDYIDNDVRFGCTTWGVVP